MPVLTTDAPPESIEDTQRWLSSSITTTRGALDDTAQRRPEGVVVRDPTRTVIAKIRFEDYERTTKATHHR